MMTSAFVSLHTQILKDNMTASKNSAEQRSNKPMPILSHPPDIHPVITCRGHLYCHTRLVIQFNTQPPSKAAKDQGSERPEEREIQAMPVSQALYSDLFTAGVPVRLFRK